MNCWRLDLRRNLSLYLNGDLAPAKVKRIEDHLLDCASCRDRFARLRTGHRLALQIPKITPQRDPWASIEAGLDVDQAPAAQRRQDWQSRVAVKPAFAFAVIGMVALIGAMFVVASKRGVEQEPAGSMIAEAIDHKEFKSVNIADIEQNREPHVVTEGYVSEIRVNDEDGDLSFKLVDELGHPGPFVVCEIIDPIHLDPPSVGSRVRVYGVSRYDRQADHNWYEVHPVLNIEVVR